MSRTTHLSAAPDQEVVEWAREGDPDAMYEVVHRYRRTVFGRIYHLVRHHETAEDLTQETFVKAFRALEDGKGPDSTLSAWLRRIANNTALDCLRREQPDSICSPLTVTPGYIDLWPMSVMSTPGYSPTPSTDPRESAAAVKRAAEQLRPPYRQCFVLHWLEGRSYDDIAETLDLPLGTVKSRIHRATEQLRWMLELAGDLSPSPG